MKSTRRGPGSRERGLSMIEILVSMTIVAFAVLGLLGLQARALSYQKDSTDRRSAAELIAKLGEQLRANHRGVADGRYAGLQLDPTDGDPGPVVRCATLTACTPIELAARDWVQWGAELRRRLPASAAYIDWDPADPTRLVVSVAWMEPTAQADTDLQSLCNVLAARHGVVIPANYRCYEAGIRP
jgi:type IV pilus assembly protein PilV